MAVYEMSVIDEKPTTEIIITKSTPNTPIETGSGEDDYVCGECSNVLLSNMDADEVRDSVYKCPSCGAYNRA